MRYRLEVTCPLCGGPLDHITAGRTTTWSACAVVRCTLCAHEVVIRVTLHAAGRHSNNGGGQQPLPSEHGTQRGYDQHRRTDRRHLVTDRDPCWPCIEAHNTVKNANRRRPPGTELELAP